MKRGIILALLVALILLLPAQAALAVGKGDQGRGEGLATARGQISEAKDKGDQQDVAVPEKAKGKERAEEARQHGKPEKSTGPPVEQGKAAPEPDSAGAPATKEAVVKAGPPREAPVSERQDDGSANVAMIEPVFVQLHGPHVGANSKTFGNGSGDVGATDEVVWHFVLNGLDHGTPAAQLRVTFQNAGEMSVMGQPVGNGSTQHFYVSTPGHDILLGAVAEVESVGVGKLVLSDVSWTPVTEPDEPDDQDNGDDQDDGDEQGDGDGQTTDEEPFLPFTEPRPQVVVYETYLPYTGDVGSLMMAIALCAAVTGGRLRSAGRRIR
jgi:hypothetical protein